MDVGASDLVEIDPARANVLRKLLSDPTSYYWEGTVATPFVPHFGFYFAATEPLAILLVAPLGEIGQGRLLLAKRQANPALTVVIFNASIADIVSIYSSANLLPSRRGAQ